MNQKKSPRAKFFKACSAENGITQSDVAFVPTKPDEPNKRAFALDPERKQRLEDLMAKENLRTKRDKLCVMLTQKMKNKFSGKNGAIIKSVISEFLDKHTQITPEDIAKLQEQIHIAIKNAPVLPEVAAKGEKTAAAKGGTNEEPASSVESKPREVSDKDNYERFVAEVSKQNAEWKIIAALQLAEKDLTEEQKAAKIKQKNIEYKKALDEQTAVILAKKHQEKVIIKEEVAVAQAKDVAKFKEENLKKEQELKKKMLDELVIQKMQVAANKARKDEEARIIAEDAQKKIKEFAEAIAAEKKNRDEKINALKENGKKVKLENDELLRIKAQMKVQEGLENIRLMKEANERAEKAEREREAAFQARMAAMAVMAEKFENDGAGKADREARIKEEQIMIKQQLLAAEAANAKEKKKIADALQREREAKIENDKLIAEKAALRQQEIEENERIALKYKQDKENFEKSLQEKAKIQKENQLKYRETINKQIQLQGKVDTKLENMSPREKIINMNEISKVALDPQLYARVVHKARMMGVAL